MAKTLLNLTQPSLAFLSLTLLLTLAAAKSTNFSGTVSPTKLRLKKEKLSHFHFYFHDTVSGRNPTAVPIVHADISNKFLSGFGRVFMMDDPLTLEPANSSKIVGRAQGIYASASQSDISFLMALNFAFTEGKYNGSNLSVLGRNSILSSVRELPIVGGSGLFRFARGYAEARTHEFNIKTGDAVVEYNVYVFHY